MHPDRAVVCRRSHGKVRSVMRPAEPAAAIDGDGAGLAIDTLKRGDPGLDRALRMLRRHALYDAGSRDHPDDRFAVARQRDAADGIVGIKPAAR